MVNERTNSKETRMSEAIQKFVFANANEVRVVMRNNEPWFVAKDVCDILGTRTDTVRQIVGNKRVMSIDPNTIGVLGNGKSQLLVNEAGLYKLVLVGRKKEAVKFQDWVVEEVLPSIRKHGVYMTDRTLDIIKDDPTYIYRIAEMLVEEKRQRVLAESERDEAIKTVNEKNDVIENQNSTIREQQSHIEWSDSQRISMAESCARFSPVRDKPCDDAKPVRGSWRRPALLADGKFDTKRNDEYHAMIRRAIRERSIPDYELSEFKTVIDADDIKGTKHTRDECALLSMLNAGHIGVIPTLF